MFLGCWFNQSRKPNKTKEFRPNAPILRKLLKVGESCRLFARLVSCAALACRGLEKKKKTNVHLGETPGRQQHWHRLPFQCGKWGPCHYVPPVRMNCGRFSCSLCCCALFHTCSHVFSHSALTPSCISSTLEQRVQLLTLRQRAPSHVVLEWTDFAHSQEWRHHFFFFRQDLASFR